MIEKEGHIDLGDTIAIFQPQSQQEQAKRDAEEAKREADEELRCKAFEAALEGATNMFGSKPDPKPTGNRFALRFFRKRKSE